MSDIIFSRYKITGTWVMIICISCRKRYPFSRRPGVRSIFNAWITTDLSRQWEGVMHIWMAVFSANGNRAFVRFSWRCSVYVFINLLLAGLTMQSIVKITHIIVKYRWRGNYRVFRKIILVLQLKAPPSEYRTTLHCWPFTCDEWGRWQITWSGCWFKTYLREIFHHFCSRRQWCF